MRFDESKIFPMHGGYANAKKIYQQNSQNMGLRRHSRYESTMLKVAY